MAASFYRTLKGHNWEPRRQLIRMIAQQPVEFREGNRLRWPQRRHLTSTETETESKFKLTRSFHLVAWKGRSDSLLAGFLAGKATIFSGLGCRSLTSEFN